MAYESKRPRKTRARAAAAAAPGLECRCRRAAAGMPPALPPAEPGGQAPRPATQLATDVSMADALPTKVVRLTVEAEQSKHAARDAQSKPYQHRYNVRKRKHGADEEDCEAGDEFGSESSDGGDNSALIWLSAAGCGRHGRRTEVAVLVSTESLHAEEAAQPHRH
eukprot:jgi/Tetstr1/438072/TSEL_026697.t1